MRDLSRRQFLKRAGGTASGLLGARFFASWSRKSTGSLGEAEQKIDSEGSAVIASKKAPFKLLYNNDCTNILSCASPFHARGERFHPRMIEASVDEIAGAGVDASLLSPDLGWVPWWPSKVYPDHYQWYEKQRGKPLQQGSFEYFVRHGGDVVQIFVDRCLHHQIAPFITYRLNDSHFCGLKGLEGFRPRFYVEHPEYQLWPGRTHNWIFPQVRQY